MLKTHPPQPQTEAARILGEARAREKLEHEEFAARVKATQDFYADKRRKEMEGEQAEHDAALQAARNRKNAEEQAGARRAWIASGGHPDAFEKAWPAIQEQMAVVSTVAELNAKRNRRPATL